MPPLLDEASVPMDEIVLSTAYFPPAIYMGLLANSNRIIIDPNEHFVKRSYRNRCKILGVNGAMALSIPVNWKNHMPVKDVKISYAEDWKKLHWRSIASAYSNSAFFEFYKDEFTDLFEYSPEFLVDWNMKALELVNQLVGLDVEIELAETYIEKGAHQFDFRNSINPRKEFAFDGLSVSHPAYQQVFSDRHEFTKNLSILDLLFNLGPECGDYLKSMIKVQ